MAESNISRSIGLQMKNLYAYNLRTHSVDYYFTVANEIDYEHLSPLGEDQVCLVLEDAPADTTEVYLKNNILLTRPARPDYYHRWDNDAERWVVDFSTLTERKSLEIKSACRTAIMSGFNIEISGQLRLYPSNNTDQLNLIASVTDSYNPTNAQNWTTPFWCANSNGVWDYRMHNAAEIRTVGSAGKLHISSQIAKKAALEYQLSLAQTPEAIEAINW